MQAVPVDCDDSFICFFFLFFLIIAPKSKTDPEENVQAPVNWPPSFRRTSAIRSSSRHLRSHLCHSGAGGAYLLLVWITRQEKIFFAECTTWMKFEFQLTTEWMNVRQAAVREVARPLRPTRLRTRWRRRCTGELLQKFFALSLHKLSLSRGLRAARYCSCVFLFFFYFLFCAFFLCTFTTMTTTTTATTTSSSLSV